MKLLLITYFYIILAAIASFAQQDTAQSSTITSEEYTSSDTSVRMITPDELPEAGDIVLPPDTFDLPDTTIAAISADTAPSHKKTDAAARLKKPEPATKSEKETADSAEATDEGIGPPPIAEIISLPKVFWSLIFIVIGYVAIRIISRILDKFAERSAGYRITIKGLIPIVRVVGWLVIIYIIIGGIIRPPLATVITVSATIGVAVGFAAQDLLKNIFGGVMILLDRPFQVGDKIEIENYYGEVVKIGLRSTRIVTPDDSLVSIPNGDLMNKSVSNANTGEANCQVVAEIYLPIDIDTNLVRQIATEAAQVSKYIYLKKPIVVLFFNEVKYQRAWYKMRLKAYVMDIRYEFAFKSDMTEKVLHELLSRNIISKSDLI
ncbi:MAG: mechanosensitive ion channel family protein [Candidatus Kapaibacterium sp.]